MAETEHIAVHIRATTPALKYKDLSGTVPKTPLASGKTRDCFVRSALVAQLLSCLMTWVSPLGATTTVLFAGGLITMVFSVVLPHAARKRGASTINMRRRMEILLMAFYGELV
jgi:hypothetical protein